MNLALSKEELLRNEIIITAQKLFQQYGLQKTTMEDIARAMGKGKSTLYYYYKSKEEIFDAVLRTEMHEVYDLSKEAVKQADTASEKLKAYFSVSFQVSKSKVNLYKIVTEEMALQNLSRTHHVDDAARVAGCCHRTVSGSLSVQSDRVYRNYQFVRHCGA